MAADVLVYAVAVLIVLLAAAVALVVYKTKMPAVSSYAQHARLFLWKLRFRVKRSGYFLKYIGAAIIILVVIEIILLALRQQP